MKTLRLVLPILLLLFMQACNDDTDETGNHNAAPTDMFMEKGDIQFANDAAKINITEIELGKLAIQKGTDKRVKNFGAQVIKTHTKREVKLQAIAVKKKIALPTTDTALQDQLAALSKNTGKAFDKAYLEYMKNNHQQGIQLLQQATKSVVDADLRKYATQNLLILNRHLDAINGIYSSIGK